MCRRAMVYFLCVTSNDEILVYTYEESDVEYIVDAIEKERGEDIDRIRDEKAKKWYPDFKNSSLDQTLVLFVLRQTAALRIPDLLKR